MLTEALLHSALVLYAGGFVFTFLLTLESLKDGAYEDMLLKLERKHGYSRRFLHIACFLIILFMCALWPAYMLAAALSSSR